MKLIAMINAIEKYSSRNLDLSINTDQPFITYYGSSQESEEGSSDEKEKPGYVKEALTAARAVKHPDDIVGFDDWEKILIDDVNNTICSFLLHLILYPLIIFYRLS